MAPAALELMMIRITNSNEPRRHEGRDEENFYTIFFRVLRSFVVQSSLLAVLIRQKPLGVAVANALADFIRQLQRLEE
jgi:hypothetical protein